MKADSGSTNFFASCFEDICYLLQLKNEGEISRGYFVLVCACTKTIQSPNKSLGYRFWKGFAPNEIGDNNKLKELSDYKEEDLPNISSWKHQKLRGFIKTDKSLNSLVGKKVEYLFKKDINSEYAYCIVEI